MNLKLDNTSYCELYIALNNIIDAIDEKDLRTARQLTEDLAHEVRYAEVE